MSAWFKNYSFKNLFRQPAPKGSATTDKYLPFFDSDDFPLSWSRAIADSPSATSCLNTVQSFLEGQKLNNKDLEKLIVNSKGHTFWEFHGETSESFAEFEGFYWLLKYNALAQITEMEVLPFENCRLGEPDDSGYIAKIYYNPFFGTKYYAGANKKLTKCYDVFNPKVVKEQMIKQNTEFKGQVLFYGTESAISRYYPVPKAYSAIKWTKNEAGIADYYEDKIDNGFLNDYMLVMKGNPSDPSSNPDYANVNGEGKPATVAQEFDDVMSRNFMGRGKHANVMVQWVNTSDEKPEVVTIPSSANGDLFLNLDNQSTKKITVAWQVPAILANINEGVTLGGDGNMVRVAVKLMQQRVVKKQKRLTDNYEKVMKMFVKPYTQEIIIVPYNPYPELEILDDKIWNEMDAEQRRDWINSHTDIKIETDETVVIPTQTARTVNAIPVGFPDKVRSNVKRALEYQDKMQLKCAAKAGRQIAQDIVDNKNMGLRQLKRIHGYLKKKEKYWNSPFNEGCEAILCQAWGGKEMHDFLEVKLKDVDRWLN